MASQQIDNLLQYIQEFQLQIDDQKEFQNVSPLTTLKDHNGNIIFSIPQCGLGTWKSKGNDVQNAVEYAIKIGYRHIDTAFQYGNEKHVGIAVNNCIKSGIVKREELFLTSKLWNPYHKREKVFQGIQTTLTNLNLDYIDLFSMHWPMSFEFPEKIIETNNAKQRNVFVTGKIISIEETWKAMEECVEKGYTKYIGISNFNHKQIEEILAIKGLKIRPVNLQNESSIYCQQNKMIEFCRNNNITFSGYSPLVSNDGPWKKDTDPNIFEDEIVMFIAKKYNKSVAQIALKFQLQRGVIIIPKSINKGRIKENFDLFNWSIADKDMETLAKLEINFKGYIVPAFPRDHPYWPFNEEY